MGSSDGNRVYLGNLPVNVTKSEIESVFKSYNPVEVTLKERFGFVEFDNKVDADDAIHDLHGTKVSGSR
jgi:arginine/serine-rich splicing factor 4/5/6